MSATTREHYPTAAIPFGPVPATASTRIRVNDCVSVDEVDGLCVVWVQGNPWHRFPSDNKLDRRIVAASLSVAGVAKPVDLVRALGVNRDTLHRDRRRLLQGGLSALTSLRRGPKGPSKVTPELEARARRDLRAGYSRREIGRRLGLSSSTVQSLIGGELPPGPVQEQLGLDIVEPSVEDVAVPQPAEMADESRRPEVTTVTTPEASESVHEEKAVADSAAECPPAATFPTDAIDDATGFQPARSHPEETDQSDLDRTEERILASLGLVSEAEVRYVSGENLRFVGALLILPALVATGFFGGVEAVYGGLKNGFYGLRHTVMTVAMMLILRIKRVERLAGVSPTAVGRLLGLDRSPEVKTLRRRLREIADMGKAGELMRWFAKHLASAGSEILGFLYVDGHTRVYYGKQEVSKAYSTRKRLALPAVTDFWVNDADGQPFFVVTGQVNQALTRQLLPLVDEMKALLPPGQRLTFIFDRGGWSPSLFKKLVESGCDFITYRKGKYRRQKVKDFSEHSIEVEGKQISYTLRDGVARFGVGMQFRQIVRLEDDGQQIAILTSRKDLRAAEVTYRLGARWRQENYFKYALEEFDLDALDTYEVEADDPERTVPNPGRKELNKRIAALRDEAEVLEAELGREVDANEESRRPSVRGFKIAHGSLRQELARVRAELEALLDSRKELPSRVTIAEATADEAVVLAVEHKHFMNIVKMAVYRAESSLFALLLPHYKRSADEGRALLREAFMSSGALRVEPGVLHVVLDPMSAPRRTYAIAALCDALNHTPVRIPGTTLRLHFEVSRNTGVSEMAMGPCQEV